MKHLRHHSSGGSIHSFEPPRFTPRVAVRPQAKWAVKMTPEPNLTSHLKTGRPLDSTTDGAADGAERGSPRDPFPLGHSVAQAREEPVQIFALALAEQWRQLLPERAPHFPLGATIGCDGGRVLHSAICWYTHLATM